MEVIVERCAFLDVHRDTVMACARTPDGHGGRREEVTEFGSTTSQLLALSDWLAERRVTLVGMEATGVYWKPVYWLLEASIPEVWVINARHMRNVPGRKTDVADAVWGASLLEHGLVRPSFIPPAPFRALRDLTRYRKAVIEERTRESQRLHKVLEDAGVKLWSVASAVLTKSGREMIDALIAGQRDPEVLAELAKGRMRTKIPQLQDALAGRFNDHHALLCRAMLARIDQADATVAALGARIDELLDPYEAAVSLLVTIPGVARRSAQVILAEIGADMSRFPTAGHLGSWAGMSPATSPPASTAQVTPGTAPSGSAKRSSSGAQAAARTKDTYLTAQYSPIRGRRGPQRAAVAVGHSILVITWHLLSTGEPYNDLGGDYFDKRRNSSARQRRLVAQLEAMGHRVTLEPAPDPYQQHQGSPAKRGRAPHPHAPTSYLSRVIHISVSSRGKSRPPALAEPYVTVSRHTAPTGRPGVNGSKCQWAKSFGSR